MPEVTTRIEIPQTGEAASAHNPPCRVEQRNAGEIILKAGAAVVDAYIGQPLATQILDQVPQGNRQWLKDRLGISNGQSNCITLCVVVPKDAHPTVTISFSETGGDGYSERTAQNVTELNGDYGTGWCAVDGATIAETDNSKLISATGKNWSDNRNRWFQLKATY